MKLTQCVYGPGTVSRFAAFVPSAPWPYAWRMAPSRGLRVPRRPTRGRP